MGKYFDKEIKELRENFWGYSYRIIYWSDDMQEHRSCTGIVIAVSIEAAIDQVRKYYIDDKDDLIEIKVKEMEYGDLGSNLVLETVNVRVKYNDWI